MRSLPQRLIRARWLHFLLGSVISFWAIYLALGDISFPDVRQVFSQVRWGYLVPALCALAVHHWFKAIRWKLLLAPIYNRNGSAVGLRDLFLALMAGQMLNLVYPGRVGDLSRIWVIGNRGPGKAATAGTLVLEKIVDTIWYALLLLGLALLVTLPDWLTGVIVVLAGMLVGFWVLLFLASNDQIWNKLSTSLRQRWRTRWIPIERILGWINSFRAGISGFERLQGWQPFARLWLLSALVWGMSLLINWLISISLGIRFTNALETFAAQLLVLIGLQVGIAVPSLPGRVGVFEYICMLALGVFGIRSSDAFSYGLLLHVVVMVPAMLAGWVALMIFGLDRRQVMDELAADQVS